MSTKLRVTCVVPPNQLTKNVNQYIKDQIRLKLENQSIVNVGKVNRVVDVCNISPGKINMNNCNTLFIATACVDIYNIKVDQRITAPVSIISMHGYYIKYQQQEIFVMCKPDPKVEIGCELKIKITRVKYDDVLKKYIILAIQL